MREAGFFSWKWEENVPKLSADFLYACLTKTMTIPLLITGKEKMTPMTGFDQ